MEREEGGKGGGVSGGGWEGLCKQVTANDTDKPPSYLQSIGQEIGRVDGEEVPPEIRGNGSADGGLGSA